jgi:uncharacterized protein (TIGR02300 family)
MTTAMQDSKALRGTKRVCAACEVRFYDLAREPIVCPSCGAKHTPAARPVIELGAREAHGGKTSWRSKAFRRPEPVPDAVQETAAAEDITEEAPGAAPEEDDVVLEQEPDEGDVSGLVQHDGADPKPD